jgi:hypothetical protein
MKSCHDRISTDLYSKRFFKHVENDLGRLILVLCVFHCLERYKIRSLSGIFLVFLFFSILVLW